MIVKNINFFISISDDNYYDGNSIRQKCTNFDNEKR